MGSATWARAARKSVPPDTRSTLLRALERGNTALRKVVVVDITAPYVGHTFGHRVVETNDRDKCFDLWAKPILHENKYMSRANLDKDPDEVAAMFDGVAKRYDLVNDLLSLGRTKAWRKAATAIIDPQPGMKILDVAAGTGSSSEPLARAGADVIPADFSEGMLAAGRKARPYLPFTKADALNLPFEEGRFDCVTISFGLRNTADIDKPWQRCSESPNPVVAWSSLNFQPQSGGRSGSFTAIT